MHRNSKTPANSATITEQITHNHNRFQRKTRNQNQIKKKSSYQRIGEENDMEDEGERKKRSAHQTSYDNSIK